MNSSQIQGGAEMKATNARILISCLALAAMVILAAPANAQPGVAFQASSLPLQARGEGLTETIGAVVLQATASGTIPSGSSVTIVYSGTIANASAITGTNALSCSINGIGGCGGGTTVFGTSATGSQLTVQFNSTVAFNPGNYIEISQVRMNVNALGTAVSTVTATLSGTSSMPASNPITFTQSTVGVSSIVNPSVKASVSAATTAIQTCNVSSQTFGVTVKELYPAALTSFNDETSFSNLGTVANGSLVSITLSNIPTGFGVNYTGFTDITGSTIQFIQSTPSSALTISTGSAVTYTFAVANGPGSDSTSVIDGATFNFQIGYTNSKGTAISGTVAPALGTVVTATATVSLTPGSGIVSFAANNEGSGTVATLGDCVTNLLFPFTTNQVGFDTSIQISNTSSDKLAFPTGGATAQSGTCTLTYYPTDLTTQTASAAGTAGTPTQFTTPSIPSGGTWASLQSASTFKGQSGYMFAVCRFLDAHAFTYVINGTQASATISQGLLALVIPTNEFNTAGTRLTAPSFETLAH
jgi:hypothetical protein